MPLYESTFIARHDMSAQQVENLAETFTKIVTENEGKVTKTEHWGIKNLAYRINKNRKGHFVHFNVDAPSAALQELERNMRISEDVLRYLTIKVDELEEGPSIMMQTRSSRDDRGRRGGRFGGPPPRRDGPPRDGPPKQDAKPGGEDSGAKSESAKAVESDKAEKPAKAAESDKAEKPAKEAAPAEAETPATEKNADAGDSK